MEIEYINGMNLGYGFNTATYDFHPPALIDVTTTRDIPGAGGQEVYYNIQVCSSTLSLSEQLKVSARAKLKYGISGSGSVKTAFLSQFKQNSLSVYLVVSCIVTNKQTLLDLTQIKLKENAENLLQKSPQNFARKYGDSFIHGLIAGGEFIGILEIESFSSSNFRQIKASLSGKGSYGLFSGSASADFEKSLSKITSEYKMKATVLKRGGIEILEGVTSQELIKKALAFPNQVRDENGYPYTAIVMPYSYIESKVSSPIDLSNQISTLEQLGIWREKFIKYQNDLEFALEHPKQFPGLDSSVVNERYNKITNEMTHIVESTRACYIDIEKCHTPELDLTLLKPILPKQSKIIPKPSIFYNYGDDDTALFVYSSEKNQPELIWRSGKGNFSWDRSKVFTADIRGFGKSELCILYDYGNDDTALFVYSSEKNQPELIWRSGKGNFSWDRSIV